MTSNISGGSDPRAYGTSRGAATTGWLVCAAMLLIVAGMFNVLHGLVAINNSDYLVNELLFSSLDTWGWIFLGWGVLQVISGAFSWSGSTWAMVTGGVMAMIAMMLWFLMIFAAPFAALVGIGVNVMILYGLTVGAEAESV